MVSEQLFALSWALLHNTEEQINLDAEEKRQEGTYDGAEAGTIWFTLSFYQGILCSCLGLVT